ncbi:MAG: sigma 54-interacting transcriptional regulator [Deltaproteobacteria bacterium]|nr:sigma 54-interacting transcriptional regulator [Deltaproteobacteria bacterium]
MNLAPHWNTVAETLHDGLLVVSPEGTILSVNEACAKLTGYTKEQLVGQSCRILNCTGCKIIGKGPGADYCGLYRQGQVRSKRCNITTRDGREVTVLKRAAVLRDDQEQVLGAVETLTDLSELLARDREIDALRRSLHEQDAFQGILGASAPMRELFRLMEIVAPSEAPVLITGPSGTGKELVARAIHQLGSRKQGPYIRVNCAALNQDLLESELFGHVKGAFTGADRARMGRFEAASGGDILLDEVGDLPLATQVKLLRVLEEKEIERVGDNQPIKVDVRILAATNRDLHRLIAEGRFREDLFYRIEGVPLAVPALAERREDIPLLARNFLEGFAVKSGKEISGLNPAAMALLVDYAWPGNVRELKHAMDYAVALCPGGAVTPEHLPAKIARPAARRAAAAAPPAPARAKGAPGAGRAPRVRDEAMCRQLLEALRQAGGNQSRAAEILGVSRVTVWNRINRCGLDLDRDL